eukprot:39335_1
MTQYEDSSGDVDWTDSSGDGSSWPSSSEYNIITHGENYISDVSDDDSDYNTHHTDNFQPHPWLTKELSGKLISKKQKQLNWFKLQICSAITNFNTHRYIAFQNDLKLINKIIKNNKWNKSEHIMPKFYVTYMSEIYEQISKLNPWKVSNRKERAALKRLKRNTEKQIYHIKQIKLFQRNPRHDFWKYMNSDFECKAKYLVASWTRRQNSDKLHQYVVFGYIRNVEPLLSKICSYIPNEIAVICLLFCGDAIVNIDNFLNLNDTIDLQEKYWRKNKFKKKSRRTKWYCSHYFGDPRYCSMCQADGYSGFHVDKSYEFSHTKLMEMRKRSFWVKQEYK